MVKKLLILIVALFILRIIPGCFDCPDDVTYFNFSDLTISNLDNLGRETAVDTMYCEAVAFRLTLGGNSELKNSQLLQLQDMGFSSCYAFGSECPEILKPVHPVVEVKIITLLAIDDETSAGADVSNLFVASYSSYENLYETLEEYVGGLQNKTYSDFITAESFNIYLKNKVLNDKARFVITVRLDDNSTISDTTQTIIIRNEKSAVMKNQSLVLLFFLLMMQPVFAQTQPADRFKIAVWFGNREIARDSIPDNGNLDFMNYTCYNKSAFDEQYAGIGVCFKLNRQWELEMKVSVLSDLAPSHFDLNATYLFSKYLGVSAGLFTYPVYIENYNLYHINNAPGFIGDIDPNFRQRIIHDKGIKGGAVFVYNYRRFSSLLKANAGLSSFSRFSETIAQKKVNGNLRREFRYTTVYSPALFFNPEMELALDCFSLGKAQFGVQLKANALLAKRSVNYARETFYWTEENPIKEKISSPKHSYGKYDVDFGFYCRF
jgi:hypothetical protein